ncbi:MAG: BLUF domain-containing protein [Gammaproteobacteria bacterium]|nr:BLUF domain-containing protein [Gammaproteobacteria bacterium]
MIRVTYISQEASPLSADALLGLLSECHRNNTARGLTGMLLFGNGTFLQSLEGEREVVEALMQKIARDPRHTGMKILRQDAIEERQYVDWSMGFERVTEKTLAEIPGLRDLGLRNFNAEYLGKHGEVVDTLLERHRAPHWDPLVRELDARDKLIKDLRSGITRARNDVEMAALVLETVVEVAKDGRLDEAHLELCRTTLRALR